MRISGMLIDIDGVLTVSWQPLPALAHLGAAAAHALMVGDDIKTDVLAAQRQGLTGSWSRPASTCPAPTTAPARRLTTSLTPSPTCRPCSRACLDRRHPNMRDQTRHDHTGQPVSVRASSDTSRVQGLFSPFFSQGAWGER
jgi:hypothetical protein